MATVKTFTGAIRTVTEQPSPEPAPVPTKPAKRD
jgi:hypothetical protein